MIDKIPGRLTDRRTPLGELNWIFTAITDTIAWNTLPRSTFQFEFSNKTKVLFKCCLDRICWWQVFLETSFWLSV
jgi:hypothetical protein